MVFLLQMTDINDWYRVRDQAIDMEDLETANGAQVRIDSELARVGLGAVNGNASSAVEVASGAMTNPLEELESLTSLAELTPDMIQRAVDLLDPMSVDAAYEAETVLSFASTGRLLNPNSAEWFDAVTLANKIHNHRTNLRS